MLVKSSLLCSLPRKLVRTYSQTSSEKFKLVVLGGGTGGCSVAAKFVSKLGSGQVAIVDPADTHYYQPMLTMVGGGMKPLNQVGRPMDSVLPSDARWIKDSVVEIDPTANRVRTAGGKNIEYDYLVVALGIELLYHKVPGLVEGLTSPDSGVCSNYSPKYAERTVNTLKRFKGGNAVFTYPNTPIKCGGAPLKACFISEHFLRRAGVRDKSHVIYRTSLPAIFAVKHYADKLNALCSERSIDVKFKRELVEVKPGAKEAIFKMLDNPTELETIKYEMLHAVPPMGPPPVLKSSPGGLTDDQGYVKVNKFTLQHDTHPNIFGIGDNTNLPTSKTAAAVAGQSGVVFTNLSRVMEGMEPTAKYDGYTSCPLVTGFSTCIMAEFDYDLNPLETFPINQSKENRAMFHMKKDLMPVLYWHAMLRGWWNGPKVVRKILHLGMSR